MRTTLTRLLRRWWRRLAGERYERPSPTSCRGRIDDDVRAIRSAWTTALDSEAPQHERDHAIHRIRAAARDLLRAVNG